MTIYDQLVIGAGISGLAAGRILRAKGQSFLILEKARGAGGRVASRRFEDREGRADHGAIAWDRRESGSELLDSKAFAQLDWLPAPPSLQPSMDILPQGMNALAKSMAEGLPVEASQTVTDLSFDGQIWTCLIQGGRRVRAKSLIVTAPLPQTAALLSSHCDLSAEILRLSKSVAYRALWTVIIKSPDSSRLLTDGYREFEHPIIQSLSEQGAKGLSHSEGLSVLHTTAGFTRQHLESSPDEIERHVRKALGELGFDPSRSILSPHRWRYAFVDQALGQTIWTASDWPGLVLAGDFALGSTITKAALSGLAAAAALTL